MEAVVTEPTGTQRHQLATGLKVAVHCDSHSTHLTNCSVVDKVTVAYEPTRVLSGTAMCGCYCMLQAEQQGSSLSG